MRVANRLVARTALLIILALSRLVVFEVEQPASTKLFMLPYMVFMSDLCHAMNLKFFNEFLRRPQSISHPSIPAVMQLTWF